MSGFGSSEPRRFSVQVSSGGWLLESNGRQLAVRSEAVHSVADLGVDGPTDWAQLPAWETHGKQKLARDFLLFYFFGWGKLSRSVNYGDLVMPDTQRGLPAIPPTVSLLLSNACNMKCVHCYNDSGRVAQNELSSAERMELADYIARWACAPSP